MSLEDIIQQRMRMANPSAPARGLPAMAYAHGGDVAHFKFGGKLLRKPREMLGKFEKAIRPVEPALAAAALVIGSSGAIDPATAAAIVGGGQGVRKHSLREGLMAGMQAYGGAQLASGIQSSLAAQSAAANPATTAGVPMSVPSPSTAGLPSAPPTPEQFAASAVRGATTPAASVSSAAAAPSIGEQMVTGLKAIPATIEANPMTMTGAGLVTASRMPMELPEDQIPEAGGMSPEDMEKLYGGPQQYYTFDSGYTGRQVDAGNEDELDLTKRWYDPRFTRIEKPTAAHGGAVDHFAFGGKSVLAPRGLGAMPGAYNPLVRPQDVAAMEAEFAANSPAPVDNAAQMRRLRESAMLPARAPAATTPLSGQSASAMRQLTPTEGQTRGLESQAARDYLLGKTSKSPIREKNISTLVKQVENPPAPTPEAIALANIADKISAYKHNLMRYKYFKDNPEQIDIEARSYEDRLRKSYLASGGSVELESGGFVVPADVVSALGNGSSSAGLELLSKHIGARPIKGPGDGMSDSIPTTIEGRKPAAIARDEAYIPSDRVAAMGGSKKLYAMMDNVRKHAHGKTSQQRKVNPGRVLPQ